MCTPELCSGVRGLSRAQTYTSYGVGFPVALMRMPSGFVAGTASSAILIIEVIGTESTIPHGPHTHPQKIREISTGSGLKSRLEPIIRGVITLPQMNCTPMSVTATRIGVETAS